MYVATFPRMPPAWVCLSPPYGSESNSTQFASFLLLVPRLIHDFPDFTCRVHVASRVLLTTQAQHTYGRLDQPCSVYERRDHLKCWDSSLSLCATRAFVRSQSWHHFTLWRRTQGGIAAVSVNLCSFAAFLRPQVYMADQHQSGRWIPIVITQPVVSQPAVA